MLSRIARQKNALYHVRKVNAKRALRLHSHLSRSSPIVTGPGVSIQEHPRRPSFQSNRNLATAAEQPVAHGSYGSFDDTPYPPSTAYEQSKPWTHPMFNLPNQFDPSSLIIMDDFLQTRPRTLRRIKGIGGDEEEMMANLDISLKVGRFDRAATLINRMGHYFPSDSPEYLDLHNRYLKGMVSHMIVTREQNMILPLQRWFEQDMPSRGVKGDATTFAIMIRMALRMFHGSKRDRAVRRYWGMATNANVQDEILVQEVLSDLEIGELSEICSSDLQLSDAVKTEMPTSPTDDVAELLAVKQKGLGLSSLKDSLSLFSNNSHVAFPSDTEGTEEQKKALYSQARQRQLETDVIKSASERWRKEFVERQRKACLDGNASSKRLGSVMGQWHSDLISRIKEELKLVDEAEANPIRTREQKERCDSGVFLRTLEPDRLAALSILAVMSVFSRGGMDKDIKVATIASHIGAEVQDEVIAEGTLKKNSRAEPWRMRALKKFLSSRKEKDGRMRWKALVRKLRNDDPTIVWPPTVVVRVGAVLMSMLLKVCKVPVQHEDPQTKERVTTLQPAFQHAYQITWGRRLGVIHLHPEIVKIVAKEPPADLLGRHLPMVCKPKPWTGTKDGGYFVHQSSIIRTPPGETLQKAYIKAALENNGLAEIRAGLDVLGNTGWAINREVFDVMLEAWNSGEAVASLAPLHPELPAPPKPSPDASHQAEKAWDAQMRMIENRRGGYHSLRCFQNFQMEVARAYRDETFYLPHNMDFRGRAYPLPPYLNQMGADNSRALLSFSEAKPLGASGLRWLKIQIASLAGFDKASLSEREQFTMDHLDDVLDSANKGLHGKRWWLEADDPWQCLAACCELRNALRLPDPTQYPSRLPIHQDGSCNGLQHYAALGGDIVGAQQVNLEPSDRPSDVYTGVSEYVKAAVAQEAAQGHPTAKLLDGRITRKIVKQTVMTNVYGVTFMGAMRQVRKQLVDHCPDFSIEDHKHAAQYIARKIFQALGTMFNGAHDIQYWLGDCASRISQSLPPEQIEDLANQALSPQKPSTSSVRKPLLDPAKKFRSTVIWTTPLGLPVVQPYRVRKSKRVITTLQNITITDPQADDIVSKRKQLQAFPPNFIHSLDATHMILSANACRDAGLTFSAVHDSFWTHASDIDDMNRILRDEFVRMHSDDVVARLAAEFNVRYGKHLFLAKVAANNTIGQTLRARRKYNKNAKLVELLDEYRRQTLLRSEDPEQQAEGRAMETAASIFEKMGGTDQDLSISSSFGETMVGHVPDDLAAAERREAQAPVIEDPTMAMGDDLLNDIDASGVEAEAETGADSPAEKDNPVKKKKKRQGKVYTWLWLPLTFRPVPAKGSWDLTRIRDSKYFFS